MTSKSELQPLLHFLSWHRGDQIPGQHCWPQSSETQSLQKPCFPSSDRISKAFKAGNEVLTIMWNARGKYQIIFNVTSRKCYTNTDQDMLANKLRRVTEVPAPPSTASNSFSNAGLRRHYSIERALTLTKTRRFYIKKEGEEVHHLICKCFSSRIYDSKQSNCMHSSRWSFETRHYQDFIRKCLSYLLRYWRISTHRKTHIHRICKGF